MCVCKNKIVQFRVLNSAVPVRCFVFLGLPKAFLSFFWCCFVADLLFAAGMILRYLFKHFILSSDNTQHDDNAQHELRRVLVTNIPRKKKTKETRERKPMHEVSLPLVPKILPALLRPKPPAAALAPPFLVVEYFPLSFDLSHLLLLLLHPSSSLHAHLPSTLLPLIMYHGNCLSLQELGVEAASFCALDDKRDATAAATSTTIDLVSRDVPVQPVSYAYQWGASVSLA